MPKLIPQTGLLAESLQLLPKEDSPMGRGIRAFLAFCRMEKGLSVNSLDAYRRALKVNPGYLEARRNLAVSQVRLRRLDEAELNLRMMIALAPQLSEPYRALGRIRLERGDAKQAARWFEQAVQLEAGYAEAWKGLGLAREQLGEPRAANEAFESCVDTAPSDLECVEGLRRTR